MVTQGGGESPSNSWPHLSFPLLVLSSLLSLHKLSSLPELVPAPTSPFILPSSSLSSSTTPPSLRSGNAFLTGVRATRSTTRSSSSGSP